MWHSARTARLGLVMAFSAALIGVHSVVAGEAAVPRVRRGLEVEDLGAPLRIRNPERMYVVRNQKTQQLHFLVTFAGGGDSPMQVFDINLDTGAARLATAAPDVRGGHWAPPFPHSNGRFYWDHRGGGRPPGMVEYDPATGRIYYCGNIPGPAHASAGWMVEGKDGRIYAGRVHLNLCRYDPATGKMEGVGPLGRHDKDYGYVYSLAVREPYTYIGTVIYGGEYYLIVYNWETGTHTHHFIPTAEEKGAGCMRDVYTDAEGNVYYGGTFLVDGQRKSLMYRLEGDRPVLVTERVPGLRQMRSVHSCPDYWTPEEARQKLGLELDLSEAVPTVWNGGTSKVRFRRKDEEWHEATAKGIAVHPVGIGNMAALPDGTLIGCGVPYNPFFRFNPKTGESAYLGPTTGSIYQIHVAGDRAYFCGYSAVLSVYDPGRPWTYRTGAAAGDAKPNPFNVLTGAQWNTHMAIGADGRVYVGGRHGRHATGGDFFRYDPRTGKTDSFRDAFKEHLVYDVIAINGGRLILVSTRPMKAEEKSARLFIYDTEADALRHIEAVPGWRDLGNIFDGGPDCYVGMMPAEMEVEGAKTPAVRIYKVNVVTGQLLYNREERGKPFFGSVRSTERRIFPGPDGCGWLFLERDGQNYLARVHPDDGHLETVVPVKGVGRLVFVGKDVYLYSGETGSLGPNIARIAGAFE